VNREPLLKSRIHTERFHRALHAAGSIGATGDTATMNWLRRGLQGTANRGCSESSRSDACFQRSNAGIGTLAIFAALAIVTEYATRRCEHVDVPDNSRARTFTDAQAQAVRSQQNNSGSATCARMISVHSSRVWNNRRLWNSRWTDDLDSTHLAIEHIAMGKTAGLQRIDIDRCSTGILLKQSGKVVF